MSILVRREVKSPCSLRVYSLVIKMFLIMCGNSGESKKTEEVSAGRRVHTGGAGGR